MTATADSATPAEPADDADAAQPDVVQPDPGGSHTARWTAGLVGVVVVGLVALFALGPGADEETSALLGERVPEVAGATIDGGSYDIDDARGRWVLVNFFATWCPPCVAEHPELVAFEQWGRETGQAEVVAVVFNDPVENVAAFFADNGGTWPVVDEPSLPLRFQVAQVPESFLVAPSGQVVQHIKGEVRADELISLIEETS